MYFKALIVQFSNSIELRDDPAHMFQLALRTSNKFLRNLDFPILGKLIRLVFNEISTDVINVRALIRLSKTESVHSQDCSASKRITNLNQLSPNASHFY